MPTPESLAEQFEEHRAHLRTVAYRMLGSASEAEDAVQESWIRLGRTDVSAVENLRAWSDDRRRGQGFSAAVPVDLGILRRDVPQWTVVAPAALSAR